MAISVAQIPAALQAVAALNAELQNLGTLLNQAQNLSVAGWVINIGNGTTPVNVTVSPEQQAALVMLYDSLKSSLVTTFGQLP